MGLERRAAAEPVEKVVLVVGLAAGLDCRGVWGDDGGSVEA
jgi:hypothetical protein